MEVGTTATATVHLVNTGNGPLHVSSLAIGGGLPNPFTANFNCPPTLAVGSGCAIPITFAPTTVGHFSTRVIAVHDGSSGPIRDFIFAASSVAAVYGQPLVLNAVVTSPTGGAVTGAVRFSGGAATLEPTAPLTGGAATQTVVPGVGTHSYTARYLGDTNSEESVSGALTVAVTSATSTTTVTSDRNPGYVNFPVTFTATIATQFGGAATGTVTFRSNNTVLGIVPVVGNQAVLARTFTTQQVANITASYRATRTCVH